MVTNSYAMLNRAVGAGRIGWIEAAMRRNAIASG
jgi:hypothetical protein